jgi:alkylhydroperoxidase/carboxymuconolactone decarboxylase family protein YurZ
MAEIDAARRRVASPLVNSGELNAILPKFAEGLARVREVTDADGALPAWAKALFMASAAAVKGHAEAMMRELARSRELGLRLDYARGASIALLISRGVSVYEKFARAVDTVFGETVAAAGDGPAPDFPATAESAKAYFQRYFGFVPGYIDVLAEGSPRALEGYFLMREAALAENPLPAKLVELLLVTVNAADFQPRFVGVHAGGARRAGASEAELVEACVCAIPIAGVAAWLPAADGLAQ